MDSKPSEEYKHVGIAASPGIAHGPVSLLREKEVLVPKYKIEEDRMKGEVAPCVITLIEGTPCPALNPRSWAPMP